MLLPSLLAPLHHPPLRLHHCQHVLLQDAVVALEHLPHEVVDRTASFELIVPPLLLYQHPNQLPLHLLNPIADRLLLVLEVLLHAPESRRLDFLPLGLEYILCEVVVDGGHGVDLQRKSSCRTILESVFEFSRCLSLHHL